MTDEGRDRSTSHWALHIGGAIDENKLLSKLSEGTLVSAAAGSAAHWPDHEAVRVDDFGITHGELENASQRVAQWLTLNGTTVGSVVFVAAPNSIALVVSYLAALRTGAMVNLVNPTLGDREVGSQFRRVNPSAVIASGDPKDWLNDIGSSAPTLTLDADHPGDSPDVRSLPPATDVAFGPNTIAHLAFTSGTTGTAKATPLTHANVLASVRAVEYAWRWSSADVLVHALPLQHAHGLTAVHLSLLAGSRSVVLSRFQPETLCDAIAEHRATVLFGVPTTYRRLLEWGRFENADLSSLRLAVSGSAPLPPRDSDAMLRILGHRPLERYGLTEAGFLLSNLYEGERFPGAVGYALPGIELQIVDEDGRPVADGHVGEIVARGPQVFAGYIDVDLDDAFLPGDWFRTGDLGSRSTVTSAVSITGRLKELIISGGMNVYPREVELVLEGQPGVRAAAVVGRPSRTWGEEVVAFVLIDDGLETDELAAAVALHLAPHKRPKHYFVVDGLPRNQMGKVVKADLLIPPGDF